MWATILAWPSPEQITLRMWWALGVIFFIFLGGVVLFLLYTAGKLLRWRSARKRAEQRAAEEKLGPDGRPQPPAAGGLCDRCGRADEKVYYLKSGARLCGDCYEALDQGRPGRPTGKAGMGHAG